MTSERKIQANRANAKLSTGPKTTQGKARAALNARRHGLAAFDVSPFTGDMITLAKKIVANDAAGDLSEIARRIARAQIELKQIQRVRAEVFATSMKRLEDLGHANAGISEAAIILSDLARRLATVDRYRRRASSRRKFAIRAFDLSCTRTNQVAGQPLAAVQKYRR